MPVQYRIPRRPGRPASLAAGLAVVVVLMLAVGIVGTLIVNANADHHREILEEEIGSVLTVTHAATGAWIDQETQAIAAMASLPSVARSVEALMDGDVEAGVIRPVCSEVSSILTPALATSGFSGFDVIDPDGTIVCSAQPGRVGLPLGPPIDGDREGVWEGEPGHALSWRDGDVVHEIWSPIYDYRGRSILAALAAPARPSAELAAVVDFARYGETGETYVFDAEGRVIIGSRFVDSGRQPATMDGIEGAVGPVPASALPRNRPEGEDDGAVGGMNLDGYTDYRGESVVGAWLYDPDLGFGLASEIDLDEASVRFRRSSLTGMVLILLAELLIAALAVAYYRIHRDGRRARDLAVRHVNTFEGAPVALWEEDFSAAAGWLASRYEPGRPDRLRSRLEADPDLVARLARMILVRNANGAAETMAQAAGAHRLLAGKPAAPLTEAAAVVDQLMAVAEGRTLLEVALGDTSRDGGPPSAVLYWRAAVATDGSPDYSTVVLALVDVSDRTEAERRLRETLESRDRLVASISHEMRTPLTAVLGYAELLRDEHDDLPPEDRRHMLEAISLQAEELSFIVEDLLAATRLETGHLAVKLVPVHLEAQAAQVIEHLRLDQRPEEVTVEGSAVAEADPARVRQIVRNLVVNALRHGGDRIVLTASRRGSNCSLAVSDNGDGIPAGDADRVFEAFQTAGSGGGRPGSIGLGLSISRRLARLMGGDLTYRRIGGRTVFDLTLPARSSGIEQASAPGRRPHPLDAEEVTLR